MPAIGDWIVPACVSASEKDISSCVSPVAVMSGAKKKDCLHCTHVTRLPAGNDLLDFRIALHTGQTILVAAMIHSVFDMQ
jgi:hypothetical protein